MTESRFIDHYCQQLLPLMVLGPTIIGFYPVTGLVNVLWGSISGFPLHIIASGHPVYGPHPLTETLAFIGWPLLMLAARVWLASHLLDWKSKWRLPLVFIWLLSIFAVAPFGSPTFRDWPIWCACE